MFRKIPLIRLLSLFTMSTAAMIVAPSAVADCSCMCVETTPYYVCTGFVNSQTQTAECDLLDCPVEDTVPAEEPVAAVEPPHPGLQCERRSVYRPDLGKHKKYNVCKPSANEQHSRSYHSDEHAQNEEAWTARSERMQAKWEGQMARHRQRQGYYDDDDGGDS